MSMKSVLEPPGLDTIVDIVGEVTDAVQDDQVRLESLDGGFEQWQSLLPELPSPERHFSIRMVDMNVFPDFALPVIATSSPRGKQGLLNSSNRNSIGGISFSGVIRRSSSVFHRFRNFGSVPASCNSLSTAIMAS